MNTSIKELKAIFRIPNGVQLTPSGIELASTYLQESEGDFHRALWKIRLDCAACCMGCNLCDLPRCRPICSSCQLPRCR